MEDEDIFKIQERPVMPTLETLKDWINEMYRGNRDGRVNIKTAMIINKIFNDEKINAVVFDNAGGMMFDIWEFDTLDKVNKFMASDVFGEDLVFGYVKDGVQTLCEYQRKYPNWNIRPIESKS